MQLKSPCSRCARRKADKNNCVKDCNAIALYNRNSEIEYTERGIIEMEKELDKLSSEHVNNIKEELTAEKPNEEEKLIEKEVEVKEKIKCCNPACDGNAMIRKATGEVINGYCQPCTRAGLSKKKKGIDMVDTEKVVNKEKKKVVELTNKSKEVVLNLNGYPHIEALLTEMSDKTMLPREHIVLSLIGDALARRIGKK